MKSEKRIFTFAGIYGLLILLPMYFTAGQQPPPALTHPEFYYGFVGCAVAWQIAFLIIGRDPVRYRPLMLAAVVEKFSFAFALLGLLAAHIPVSNQILAGGAIDAVLGSLFIWAWVRTRPA